MMKGLLVRLKKLLMVWLVLFLMVLMFGCADRNSELENEYFFDIPGGWGINDEAGYSIDYKGSYINEAGSFIYSLSDGYFDLSRVIGPVHEDRTQFIANGSYSYLMEGKFLKRGGGSSPKLISINLIPIKMILDSVLVSRVMKEFSISKDEAFRFYSYTCGFEVSFDSLSLNENYKDMEYYELYNLGLKSFNGVLPNRPLSEIGIRWYIDRYLSIDNSKKEEFFQKITSGFFNGAIVSGLNFGEYIIIKYNGTNIYIDVYSEGQVYNSIKLEKLQKEDYSGNFGAIGNLYWGDVELNRDNALDLGAGKYNLDYNKLSLRSGCYIINDDTVWLGKEAYGVVRIFRQW